LLKGMSIVLTDFVEKEWVVAVVDRGEEEARFRHPALFYSAGFLACVFYETEKKEKLFN